MTQPISLKNNRAFLFGDAVFETVKILDNKILFLEDHYFRLMASMRILRMEIPMNFTMEFFENEILSEVKNQNISSSARARITVYRNDGGFYLPLDNNVSYQVVVSKIETSMYFVEKLNYEVDIYKDFYVSKQLISTLKSTNRIINVTGSIYASENGLDNCLLLNEEKNIAEALQGNIFMLKDGILSTPPISDGCLNGIMRKQILVLSKTIEDIEVIETSISPFDLQKADELFITNVIKGVQPITRYRKKDFETKISNTLITKLNAKIRLT
jgi:branched-chain amino acid aminotransferase